MLLLKCWGGVFWFFFSRKLFSGKSKVSEQPGEKEKWVVQPEPHLSPCASPTSQPGTLEKCGYQLCEPLCLTAGRHGLSACRAGSQLSSFMISKG